MIIPYNQPSKITEPGNGAFNFPSPSISSQRPSILSFLFSSIRLVRDNQFYSSSRKSKSQRVGIGSFIVNQTLDPASRSSWSSSRNKNGIQCFFNQRDFRRGRRVQVVPQRNSLAICHHHPLRTLSTFGLSDAEPPFLADEKLPSAKVSAHFNWPRSSSSAKNDRQASNQTSCSSHSCNRLQQVDGDGYWGGKSFHRAPLRRTHRIPSKQRRADIRRLPFRSLSDDSRKGAIFSHCLSVNSLRNRLAGRESSFVGSTPCFQFIFVTG